MTSSIKESLPAFLAVSDGKIRSYKWELCVAEHLLMKCDDKVQWSGEDDICRRQYNASDSRVLASKTAAFANSRRKADQRRIYFFSEDAVQCSRIDTSMMVLSESIAIGCLVWYFIVLTVCTVGVLVMY